MAVMDDDEKISGAGWVTWLCYNFLMLSFGLLVFSLALSCIGDLTKSLSLNPTFWVTVSGTSVVLIGFINFVTPPLLKFWFDYTLEVRKRKLLQTDKAASISDLLVLLQKSPFEEEDRRRANKHFLDLCLYLPPCLIHKMAEAFRNSEKGQAIGGPLGLFVEVRKFIDGTYKADPNSKFSADNIPQIPPLKEPEGGAPQEGAQ